MLEMARDVHRAPAEPAPHEDTWPGEWPRHKGDGRPKIRTIEDPTKLVWYRRPSDYGDRIEDAFMLDRRNDRLVVAGMAKFPGLVAKAQELLGDIDDPRFKAGFSGLRDEAISLMGGNAKAERGTALHGHIERALTSPAPLAGLDPSAREVVEAALRLIAPFTVWATELRVVNDRSGTAGTTDVVVSPRYPMTLGGIDLTPDDVLVADWKTGEHVAELGRVCRAVQLDQYGGAQPYVHVSDEAAAAGDDGRRTWRQIGAPSDPRRDIVLVFHVPQDRPADAGVLALNMVNAERLSRCADEVWWARCLRPADLFVPVEVPPESAPYCEYCDYDRHVCQGCGEPVRHEQGRSCGKCTDEPVGGLEMARTIETDVEPEPVSAQDAIFAHLERTRLEALIRHTVVAAHLDVLRARYAGVWTPQHQALYESKLWELGVSA